MALAALLVAAAAQAAGPRVGVIMWTTDKAVQQDVVKQIDDLKVFSKVEVIDASFAIPNLMTLKNYDAVLVYGDTTRYCPDPVSMGNVLSDAVEASVGVVIANPYVSFTSGVTGKFSTYYLLNPGGFAYTPGTALGMKLNPMHPVLSGVNNIQATNRCYQLSNVSPMTVLNGGQVLANWNNGNGMVMAGTINGRPRVDINMTLATTNAGFYGCAAPGGDTGKLMANALLFVANPLRANPSEVDFGEVGMMTLSSPQTTVVTNSGTTPVVITSGQVTPSGEFTVTLNGGVSFPITLNPAQSFSFDTRLRPNGMGPRSAIYVIKPMTGPDLSVPLNGVGIGPKFVANPATVDYGGIKFKGAGMTSSREVVIQLKNGGGGQLRLKQVALKDSTNYALNLMGLMLPNILTGGAFQTVGVTFTPQSKGVFNTELEVTYDLIGGAANQVASVALKGSSGDPQIELPGTNITLQPVRVGKEGAVEYIAVTNRGQANLSITALTLGGMNAGDFKVVSRASMAEPLVVLPNGGETDVEIQFIPKMRGLRRTTLTIVNDDPDPMRASISMNIDARGTVATFEMSPMSLDFGPSQRLGTCSASRDVAITNNGDDDLSITAMRFEGAGAGSYRQPLGGTRTISGNGGRLTIPVSFCPTGTGAQPARLVIESDVSPGHKAEVALAGVGKGPRVVATPAMVDFGAVYIKTVAPARKVTLKNEGDEDLVFGKPTAPAGTFSVTGLPIDGSKLIPGATLEISVTASPMMASNEPQKGTIEIPVNDEIVGRVLKIELSVIGTQANITVLPRQMMFNETAVGVRSNEQSLSILNSGDAPLLNLSLTLSGAASMDFGFTGEVPAMLPPRQSASFKVFFKPTSNGERSAILVVNAAGLAVQEQIKLDGKGKFVTVACTPESLEFGRVAVGESQTREVLCRNSDKSAIEFEATFDEFQTDWQVEAESTLIPGAQDGNDGLVSLNITFKPTDVGVRTSTLFIRSKEGGIILGSVGLEGSGLPMKMDTDDKKMGGCQMGGARAGQGGALFGLMLACALMVRRRRRS